MTACRAGGRPISAGWSGSVADGPVTPVIGTSDTRPSGSARSGQPPGSGSAAGDRHTTSTCRATTTLQQTAGTSKASVSRQPVAPSNPASRVETCLETSEYGAPQAPTSRASLQPRTRACWPSAMKSTRPPAAAAPSAGPGPPGTARPSRPPCSNPSAGLATWRGHDELRRDDNYLDTHRDRAATTGRRRSTSPCVRSHPRSGGRRRGQAACTGRRIRRAWPGCAPRDRPARTRSRWEWSQALAWTIHEIRRESAPGLAWQGAAPIPTGGWGVTPLRIGIGGATQSTVVLAGSQ